MNNIIANVAEQSDEDLSQQQPHSAAGPEAATWSVCSPEQPHSAAGPEAAAWPVCRAEEAVAAAVALLEGEE